MIYPHRELEELYIENQSIWEEVYAGEQDAEAALEYMQVEPDSQLWEDALRSLVSGRPPL